MLKLVKVGDVKGNEMGEGESKQAVMESGKK